jgi:UDP-N-acetylglucosamine acyltransferase
MVHPTAIIHPKARIGADCEIGPYCVIGEHVELGPGCRLRSHVVIDGHTRLGQGNEIFPFASIGLRTQDLKWKGGVTRTEIGDHNTVRECVTIHSATGEGEATVIGSHNNILGLCAVHQFCRIGTMAMIAGCAKVVQDVPPYVIVDGNPAEARTINKVGLERNGVSEEAQAALRQAYKILFRDGLTTPNALARIESELPPLPELKHLVQFVRGSERGITK